MFIPYLPRNTKQNREAILVGDVASRDVVSRVIQLQDVMIREVLSQEIKRLGGVRGRCIEGHSIISALKKRTTRSCCFLQEQTFPPQHYEKSGF